MRNPALAMANGVSFVCATCEKFWWGADRGLDGCKAVYDKTPCSGPLGGRGFPQYEGPLKGNLLAFCFATGQPSTVAVTTPDSLMVGASEKGLEVLMRYSPEGKAPRFVTGEKPDLKHG